jgi:hypothetical protein
MEPLTWSGALGPILNPIMLAAIVVFALGFVTNFMLNARRRPRGRGADQPRPHADIDRTPVDYALMAMKYAVLLFVACCAGYIVGGMVMPTLEAQGHHRGHGRAPDAGLDRLVVGLRRRRSTSSASSASTASSSTAPSAWWASGW